MKCNLIMKNKRGLLNHRTGQCRIFNIQSEGVLFSSEVFEEVFVQI